MKKKPDGNNAYVFMPPKGRHITYALPLGAIWKNEEDEFRMGTNSPKCGFEQANEE